MRRGRRWAPDKRGLVQAVVGVIAAVTHVAFPMGAVLDIVLAIANVAKPDIDTWYDDVIASVDQWARSHPDLMTPVGGLRTGWGERFVSELDSLGASTMLASDSRARSVVVDALTRAAFTPLDNSEAAWEASRAAADQLATDLPTVVVAATGEQSGLAALLSVLRSDLDEILARLPPAPADRAVCESYLSVLADDLDHSMWTHQAGGRELSLTAVAGRLRATARPDSGYNTPPTGGDPTDALKLAARCERLVLVGGTGTGKSWLAQRIAIGAAEEAAADLVSGGDLATVEIPLFVRCSGAFRRDLPAWDAIVAVTLAQIGHRLGSSRLTEALRRRFTEHGGRFLVVLDGLDEAADVRDSDLLYRLATTAGRQLRIVLTTRPDSWRRQLPLDARNSRHLRADLAPMTYPDDVLPVIDGWLSGYPDARDRLTALLRVNAGLAKATETPLLCAMLCLLEEAGTSPATAEELTGRTMTRLLEGSWRGTSLSQPDRDAARAAARELAWAGARSDPATGLAAWPRTIQHTFSPALSEQLDRGLSHVAPALPYDPDQTSVAREFLHPSFREYLVAEHIAALPPDQAARVIEPHLWYDPQWRPVLSRAIAAHPDRGVLLDAIIRGQAGDLDHAAALDRRDGFGELRGLLLSLAAETSPGQWPQPLAALIDQECQSERVAGHQDRETLMAARGRGWPAAQVTASELAELVTTEWGMSPSEVRAVAGAVPLSDADRQRLIADLLNILAPQSARGSRSWSAERAVILLDAITPPQDAARDTAADALAEQLRTQADPALARALRLVSDAPATPVLQAILEQIPSRPGDSLFRSTTVTDVKIQSLALTLDELGADTGTRRQAITRILAYLAVLPDGKSEEADEGAAERVATAIVRLQPTAQERGQAIAALFGRLNRARDSWATGQLMRSIKALSPPAEQAGAVLLELVRHGPWNRSHEAGQVLGHLAAASADDDRTAAIAQVTRHFADARNQDLYLWALHLTAVAPLPAEREAAAEALIARLPGTPVNVCGELMSAARELQPNASQRHRLVTYLLQGITPEVFADLRIALCEMAAWFSPDGTDRDTIAGTVLDHAESEPITWDNLRIYDNVLSAGLFTSAERERLLNRLLARLPEGEPYQVARIARMISSADPAAQLREDTAKALLARLIEAADEYQLDELVMRLHELQPAYDWRVLVKDHLVAQLAAGEPARMGQEAWRTLLQGLTLSDADRESLARAIAENLKSPANFDEATALAELDAIHATVHQETAVAALMVERIQHTYTYDAARIGTVLSRRALDADLQRAVVDMLTAHLASAESGHLQPLLSALGGYPLSNKDKARIGATAIDQLESIDISRDTLPEVIDTLLATCGTGDTATSRRALDVVLGHVARGGRVDAQLARQLTRLGFNADELVRFTARQGATADMEPQLRDLASLARRNCNLASWHATLDQLAECRPGRLQPPDGPISDQLT